MGGDDAPFVPQSRDMHGTLLEQTAPSASVVDHPVMIESRTLHETEN